MLDTNVVVSGYLSPAGTPARVVALWRAGRFELVCSPFLLEEYGRALAYDRARRRHRMSLEQIQDELKEIGRLAVICEPASVPAVITADPSDDQVLACARAGEADYVVSGDRHLLSLGEYKGIRILSPAAFALLLRMES